MAKTEFETTIESQMCMTIEQIREMPLDGHRRMVEKQTGRPVTITGKGLISHQEIERLLDKALK